MPPDPQNAPLWTGFTYLHASARDLLAPVQVLPDYIFETADTCREYMQRCLRDPEDHVVLEGTWTHEGADVRARTTFRATVVHPFAVGANVRLPAED